MQARALMVEPRLVRLVAEGLTRFLAGQVFAHGLAHQIMRRPAAGDGERGQAVAFVDIELQRNRRAGRRTGFGNHGSPRYYLVLPTARSVTTKTEWVLGLP